MIGTELDGRYRIEAELGSGGAGTVYRAVDLTRGTSVAVKVLRVELASSAELRQRFARETRALTSLSHPNIVAVIDSGVAAETAYLVMELLEGETLSGRLKRGALPTAEALSIMRELLGALAFVHEQGLVHRDVKPANIFLETAGGKKDHVRLLDFGLAKFLAPEAGGPALTRAGQIFGTPSYMAPEQIAGQAADPRTDVYAAGIVLFEMLVGKVPFEGDASEVMRRHIMDDLPLATKLPQGVPAGVVQVLRTATAKTRAGRFADAREMLEELDRTVPAAPDAQPEPAPDAYAPTLSLDEDVVRSATAEPLAKPSEPETSAFGRRLARLGTTVAVLVSLTAAAVAAVSVYVLVTPGREDERRTLEDVLGLPSASASAAAFQPKTLHSPKAWPPASEETPLPAPAVESAEPPPELPEPSAAPVATAPPSAPSAETPPPAASAAPPAPTQKPPPNPWNSTPGELRGLMARLNKTRGFDKRDMHELHQYNGKHPTDPRGHLLLARGYLGRRWVKDAANEFAIALKIDDGARGDPRMLPDLIRLTELGSDEAEHLIVETFGAYAVPFVDKELAAQARPEVKARLEHLAAALK